MGSKLSLTFTRDGRTNKITANCTFHTTRYHGEGSTPEEATVRLIEHVYDITTARVSDLDLSPRPDQSAQFAARLLSPISLVAKARAGVATTLADVAPEEER